MKFLPLLLLVLTTATPLLHAQQPTPVPETRINMWRCNLPGGSYSVALRSIVAVSSHEYLIDGAVRVTEVNIDTSGNALARFYFITPVGTGGTLGDTANAALERGKGLLDAGAQHTGVDLANMVIKKYPDTTHARTIEYRIPTETQLTSLFNSAKQAWQSGQGGQFTVQLK